jgi:hypothetical protein
MKLIKLVLAVLLCSTVAYAAGEARAPKPFACQDFTTARTPGGAEIGFCAPSKPDGKPTLLRSFSVATVTDPATSKPVRVMVGFR